ncbi:hypothetical protein [Streptomyces sp. RTd22]|uniref:hypothetical protein n=1 Tax=Streptomyces sp. RTd22 TaxID=1841249 RepID=UPI0007C54A0B|nr:hypothetical protein [Streptomyces sp. RTd22]
MIPLLRPPLSSYDAVGVAERYGPAVMERLPRVGCVLGAGGRWWWIVPSQSDVGVNWPSAAVYAVGAVPAGAPPGRRTGRAAEGPRVVHSPDDGVPYTHPLLLHIAVCAVAGVSPAWPREDRRSGS